MSCLVAANPKEMQLVENYARHNRYESVIVKKLNQIRLIGARQGEIAINGVDELLSESSKLDQCACRIGMSVPFRKSSKRGQFLSTAPQEFKVQRPGFAHVHDRVIAVIVPLGAYTILLHPVAQRLVIGKPQKVRCLCLVVLRDRECMPN